MIDEKVIVIGGGVGPLAGVKLHQHIIENTLTNGTDQDHLEIYHLSRSADIMDRTEALLSGTPEIPAEGMFRTFKIADAALKTVGKTGVGGVPCNTFHAPAIFNHFTQLVSHAHLSTSIINMITETGLLITEQYPSVHRIGLLSTTGTRRVRVYHDALEPKGFFILHVTDKDQEGLHDAIYDREWGIKAASAIDVRVREKFKKYLHLLIDQGAEAVILGCTEIPLALPEKELFGVPLIDPMLALARALIKEANPGKLKPR